MSSVDPLALDIDVPATAVSGRVTVNGAAPPTGSGYALVYMRSTAGDRALLATVGPGSSDYAGVKVPGTYDIYYEWTRSTATTGVPSNLNALLRSGVVVGSTAVALNVDIPATVVSGTIAVNGAQVPQASGTANLSLRNAAGDNVALGTTAAGSYSRLVVPGTYDLYYAVATAGTGVPSNAAVKVQSGIAVGSGPQALNIDVPTTAVSGTITVNGAQVPQASGIGSLNLRNATGDDAVLGTTAVAGAYSQRVVPGTYDLYYVFVTGPIHSSLPFNKAAKLRSGIVVGSTPLVLDIDVPSTKVLGR